MCPSPRVPANPLATPRRPAAPFTAACKRSESPRPGSGAGRWPAARPSCPGRLAGVELLRKLSPRKGWLPCPRLSSRGMTQASPPGQAESRRRVSLLLPGLGNYSRAPVGAPCLRPGLGALSEFEGGGPGRRRNSERDSHSGAGGETERKHKGRGTNPGKWKTGRSGETERKGPEPEKERNGNRRRHADGETETQRETKRRQKRTGVERLAARRGPDRAAGTREPRGRAPGAAPAAARPDPPSTRPAFSRPRISLPFSLGRGTPTEKWKPLLSRGTGSGRRGAPWPPRAAPTSPDPAPRAPSALGLGGGASARCPGLAGGPGARRCACGRSLWKLGARVPARAGLTARAAAVGSAARPPVPAELSAGRGGQARRPREARGGGRQGWRRPREARLSCAARCLRPRAGARCGGAASRAAPTSGVSPLQIGSEGGGSGGRDAKKKERAGALGRSLRARRRGRLSRPGPRPLLSVALEPRAGLRRGPTARRSYRGRPDRRPRGRAESPAPRLVLKRPPPDFSALGLLCQLSPSPAIGPCQASG